MQEIIDEANIGRSTFYAHFLIHHLVGSFAETVKWWVAEDTKHLPEEVAGYYMKVLQVFC